MEVSVSSLISHHQKNECVDVDAFFSHFSSFLFTTHLNFTVWTTLKVIWLFSVLHTWIPLMFKAEKSEKSIIKNVKLTYSSNAQWLIFSEFRHGSYYWWRFNFYSCLHVHRKRKCSKNHSEISKKTQSCRCLFIIVFLFFIKKIESIFICSSRSVISSVYEKYDKDILSLGCSFHSIWDEERFLLFWS